MINTYLAMFIYFAQISYAQNVVKMRNYYSMKSGRVLNRDFTVIRIEHVGELSPAFAREKRTKSSYDIRQFEQW